jgi:hypothetical protein
MITGAGKARVGEDTVELKFTVPEGACAPEALLPGAQALANKVAELGEARARSAGLKISCTKGCGACCRQMVPISPTEARHLAALVAALPPGAPVKCACWRGTRPAAACRARRWRPRCRRWRRWRNSNPGRKPGGQKYRWLEAPGRPISSAPESGR